MYTLKSINVRNGRVWATLDNHHVLLQDLLHKSSEVLINFTVDNDITHELYQIELQQLWRVGTIAQDVYIDDYVNTFDQHEGLLLYTSDYVKNVLMLKPIKYSDAWDLGVTLDRGSFHTYPDYDPNVNYAPDIVVGQGTRVSPLSGTADSLIFTVNGRVHWSVERNGPVYILGGQDRLDNETNKQVGVIDTAMIGGHTTVQCTATNTSIYSEDQRYAYVHIDITDIPNVYTPITVVDGILHCFTDDYRVLNNDTLLLRVDKRKLLRYATIPDTGRIDWVPNTNLEHNSWDYSKIDVALALRSTVSGIVFLHSNAVCVHTDYAGRTGLPNRYTFPHHPTSIMQFPDGTMGEYKVTSSTMYEVELSVGDHDPRPTTMETIPDNLRTGVNLNRNDNSPPCEVVRLLTIYKL